MTTIPEDISGGLYDWRSAYFNSMCYRSGQSRYCYKNYCAQGRETSTKLEIIGKEMHPFGNLGKFGCDIRF